MFCLIHTQKDWKGSMFPRKGNRLFCRRRRRDVIKMIQTGKQVTQ